MTIQLSYTQRIKISNILFSKEGLNGGQIKSLMDIITTIKLTPEEITHIEFTEEAIDSDQGAGTKSKWAFEKGEEKKEFNFGPLASIHLKQFILTFNAFTSADVIWLTDLFDQLGVTDEDLQKV